MVSKNHAGAQSSVPRVVVGRSRQRRPGYIVVLVVLVVGLAATGGWLYVTAGEKQPVAVVARHVPVGQVITRDDLTTTDVAGGITAVSGANLHTLVGQRAAVELLPGMVMLRAMVTDAPALTAGQAQVGVAVKGGQMPAEGLSPGDVVEVYALAGKPAEGAQPAAALLGRATVLAAKPNPAQAGGMLVTVMVPAKQVAVVVAASAAGTAALVQVPS